MNPNDKVSTAIGASTINKKWDERTTDEKLDVLRSELRDFRYLINRIAKLEDDARPYRQHRHASDGTMLVPFQEKYDGDLVSLSHSPHFDRLA
jgi:hypothetical protein